MNYHQLFKTKTKHFLSYHRSTQLFNKNLEESFNWQAKCMCDANTFTQWNTGKYVQNKLPISISSGMAKLVHLFSNSLSNKKSVQTLYS